MEIIFALQVVALVVILLWTYDRYAKRWVAIWGNDSVDGRYDRVDSYSHNSGREFKVEYVYVVDGRRYFGSFTPEGFGFKWYHTADAKEKLEAKYPRGGQFKVFYWRDGPATHWLHNPPSRRAVLWKAFGLPLIILILIYVPLLFAQFLIILSAE